MNEKELEKLSKKLHNELNDGKNPKNMGKLEKNLFLFIFLVVLIGIIVMWLLPH